MYELTIDVDDCTSSDVVLVRAWIDYLQNAELTTEVELALYKEGANKWTANFSVPGDNEEDAFAYRVGLVAQPGATWSLRIRECSEGDLARILLEDGDVLTTRKEWLLGTCDAHR